MRASASQPPENLSTGELVSRISEQLSTLVHNEIALAESEMKAKAKKAGIGAGLFGGAGIVAIFAVGCFVASAVLGLAIVLDPWLAALVVGVALLGVTAVVALVGKKEISEATPPIPSETISSVQADINAIKTGARR